MFIARPHHPTAYLHSVTCPRDGQPFGIGDTPEEAATFLFTAERT